MGRIIVTTSNNLVFDNRVYKVTQSLMKLGYEVWQTGRNYPKLNRSPERAGRKFLFNLPINKGPLFYFFLNLYTFGFLLFRKFDIVWAVDMDTLCAAKIAAAIKRKPVIFDSHEFLSESPEIQEKKLVKLIWTGLEKVFIKRTNLRYTVSPGLIELYKNRYNIDFKLLRNLPHKKQKTIVPLLESETPTILYQGALNLGRGIAETIEAMQYLPGYKFVIVGRGDCSDELKNLTVKLGLEDRVEFTGSVPFEELEKFHTNVMAGMCLLENIGLNYYHSLPNRIFDYMQAGIPVIATSFPDISEIVKTHQTGILINNLNPKEIASTIQKACEDKELRKKWQNTLPAASREFVWEREEELLIEIKQGCCLK